MDNNLKKIKTIIVLFFVVFLGVFYLYFENYKNNETNNEIETSIFVDIINEKTVNNNQFNVDETIKNEIVENIINKNIINNDLNNNQINDSKNSKININVANELELETLPGIGSKVAKSIIEYRQTNGLFKNIDEIKNVKRIGEKTFEKIKNLISVN